MRVDMERERVRQKGETYRNHLRLEAMTVGNPTRQHVLRVALVDLWEVAKLLNDQEVVDQDWRREERLSWLDSRREERAKLWMEEKEVEWLEERSRMRELEEMEQEVEEMEQEVGEMEREEEARMRKELGREVAKGAFAPDDVWEVDQIIERNGNLLQYIFLEVERPMGTPTPDYNEDEDMDLLAIYRFLAYNRMHQ